MVKEQERKLFDRWQSEQKRLFFIRDGVFDEETWNAEPLKITFVLKEADWPNVNRDMCRHVLCGRSPTVWKTWNNVARWTKGLLEGGGYPRNVSEAERVRLLARVSFLNLKKAGGGRRANPKEIRKAARQDAALLREQLLLYQPDLIVCCGKGLVADVLEKEVLQRPDLFGPYLSAQDHEELDGISCFYTRFPGKERLTPAVDFCHPEWIAGGHARWQADYEKMKTLRAVLLPPVV